MLKYIVVIGVETLYDVFIKIVRSWKRASFQETPCNLIFGFNPIFEERLLEKSST